MNLLKTDFLNFKKYYYTTKQEMANINSKIENLNAGSTQLQNGNGGSKTTVIDTSDINNADIIIKNHKIVSITVHQLPDTSSAKKAVVVPKSISDPMAEIDSLWGPMEQVSQVQMMRLMLFYNNLIADNMSFTTAPIFSYGDRMGIIISITPTDSFYSMGIAPTYIDQIILDLPVYWKPMYSFSVGTFFGGSRLAQPTYQWEQVPVSGNIIQSNSPYKLRRTSDGSMPIGAAAFANVTWTVCHIWNFLFKPGVSFGVGVANPTINPTIAYLLGGTVAIGKYQHFNLSGGLALMQMNVLKESYSQNFSTVYSANPGSVSYTPEMVWGTFFSVSYTLFKPKYSNELVLPKLPEGDQ